ncbi:MAG: hypothetical protein AAFR07_12415 [Pseudomonadota bacterium]
MWNFKTAQTIGLLLVLGGCTTTPPEFAMRSKVVDTWVTYRVDSDSSRVYEVRTFHADGTLEGSVSDQMQIYGEFREVSSRRYTGQWELERDTLTVFGLLFASGYPADAFSRDRILAIDGQRAIFENMKTGEVVVHYRQSAQQTGMRTSPATMRRTHLFGPRIRIN